jgi:hypothetical protein
MPTCRFRRRHISPILRLLCASVCPAATGDRIERVNVQDTHQQTAARCHKPANRFEISNPSSKQTPQWWARTRCAGIAHVFTARRSIWAKAIGHAGKASIECKRGGRHGRRAPISHATASPKTARPSSFFSPIPGGFCVYCLLCFQ